MPSMYVPTNDLELACYALLHLVVVVAAWVTGGLS